MKRIAISQSNYIPWKGYFDLIAGVDEFVLYDDAQYTRRDWRNRNLVKTPSGLHWLTIPVQVKGRFHQRICDTGISEDDWPLRHWRTIELNYARAAHFDRFAPELERLYRECHETRLSEVNRRFLDWACATLGIRTRLTWSSDYALTGDRSERLLGICRQAGAAMYLSGPAAKDYLDEAKFAAAGVQVAWMDYAGYPPYRQLFGEFQHGVSILDLILNEGPGAPAFMKNVRPDAAPA